MSQITIKKNLPPDTTLKIREKLAYAMGDLGFNLFFQTISLYLLYFYTDVFGITAAAAGTIILTSRIWDAVNDPIMGYLADHTNTRWGRFRPYLLIGTIPLAISTVLCFSVPEISLSGKVIYAFFTFILFTTIYTIVNIPYSALTAVLTQDPVERTSLTTYRMICMIMGLLIVSVATEPLVNLFSTEAFGFQMTLIMYSILAVVFIWITFSSVKERLKPTENKYSFRDIHSIIIKNKPLLFLLGAYIFYNIFYTIRFSATVYFFKYNIAREELIPFFFLTLIVSIIAGMVLIPVLIKKIEKRTIYMAGGLIGIIANTGFYLTDYTNIPQLFIFSAFASFAAAGPIICSWAMIPDTVEYSEWKTGIRGDGIIYSVFFFCQKAGMAIAAASAGFILSYTRYVPNIEQQEAALKGISHMMSTIPSVCSIIMISFIFFYRLDSSLYKKIVQQIQYRKQIDELEKVKKEIGAG